MADDLAGAAKKLGKGFEIGTLKFWGGAAWRPGDVICKLLSASAHGDRLDLQLSAPNDPKARGDLLSVFGASGVKIGKRGFTIAKADKLSWGGREFAAPTGAKAAAVEAE